MEEKDQLLKYTLAKLAEAPLLVKNHLDKEGKQLKFRRAYFRIQKYADSFLLGEKHGSITSRLIILPGLRGVGKTTILYQLYDYLRNVKKVDTDRVLYFSTDELKSYLGGNILDVIDTFIQDIHKTTTVSLDKEIFILIDESHFDPEWSQTAKIFFDKSKKIFMLFTGSSALNLELSVDAARRTTKEIVFPMNFSEYLTLRHEFFPPKGMVESLRYLIFNGDSEASLSNAIKQEAELIRSSVNLKRPIQKEWEDYICYHGFPFSLGMKPVEIHEKTFNMIDRVIEKDVFSIKAFSTDTRNTISRILTFLALQSPGGTSDAKLADHLKTSPSVVRNILDVLEKTHLIFSIKPYGGAGKTIRKAWKYYFLSPSLTTSIRFKLGAFDKADRELLGLLAESLIASYFLRMKETINMPQGLFYDPEKESADLLIIDKNNNIIPIEIGIGKKDKSQVKNSISRHGSKYGIIVCDCPQIKKEGNVIYIPISTFSFV